MELLSKPKGICPCCGAEFTYTAKDVKLTGGKKTRYINCPGCGRMLSFIKAPPEYPNSVEPRKVLRQLLGKVLYLLP